MSRVCEMDGCERPFYCRSICKMHYQRYLKHGDPSKSLTERHGYDGTKMYGRWTGMKQRCNCVTADHYKDYGGRGINVCKGWNDSFIAYFSDVGECPAPGLSIDRVNNDGGYWCGHCEECVENGWPKNWRWATKREQQLNKRKPVKPRVSSKATAFETPTKEN